MTTAQRLFSAVLSRASFPRRSFVLSTASSSTSAPTEWTPPPRDGHDGIVQLLNELQSAKEIRKHFVALSMTAAKMIIVERNAKGRFKDIEDLTKRLGAERGVLKFVRQLDEQDAEPATKPRREGTFSTSGFLWPSYIEREQREDIVHDAKTVVAYELIAPQHIAWVRAECERERWSLVGCGVERYATIRQLLADGDSTDSCDDVLAMPCGSYVHRLPSGRPRVPLDSSALIDAFSAVLEGSAFPRYADIYLHSEREISRLEHFSKLYGLRNMANIVARDTLFLSLLATRHRWLSESQASSGLTHQLPIVGVRSSALTKSRDMLVKQLKLSASAPVEEADEELHSAPTEMDARTSEQNRDYLYAKESKQRSIAVAERALTMEARELFLGETDEFKKFGVSLCVFMCDAVLRGYGFANGVVAPAEDPAAGR